MKPIYIKSVFKQLEELDFSDKNKVIVINCIDLKRKQKNVIHAYAKYRGYYSFVCNCKLFPILNKVYRCKKCDQKFTNNNFHNDSGSVGYNCDKSYIKCLCDPKSPAILYSKDDASDDNLTFRIIRNLNSILITKQKLSSPHRQQISIDKIISSINRFQNIEFYYDSFDRFKDNIFGSKKIDNKIKKLSKAKTVQTNTTDKNCHNQNFEKN